MTIPTTTPPAISSVSPAATPPAPLILRDIHLPQAVSWWPLAPGWWIILGGLILLVIILIIWLRRRHKRRYRRIALAQLSAWEQNLGPEYDPHQLVQQLSQLLRHMAMLHYPPQQCAGLYANAWLNFLDKPFHSKNQENHPFSNGVGRCLAEVPYQTAEQAQNSLDINAAKELIQLSRRWLKTLPLPTKSRRSA